MKIGNRNQNGKHLNVRNGFTLVEAMVAIFVFSLVMISVVSIFSKFIIVQKRSKAIQQNLEDAKYAMELMAKTIRTSSVVYCLDNVGNSIGCGPSVAGITVYDHSQGMCIIYIFSGGKIQSGSASAADNAACLSVSPSIAVNPIVGNTISQMNFGVDQTITSTKIGKVTIFMEICSDSTCSGTENDRARLQTTVSLRDYQEAD